MPAGFKIQSIVNFMKHSPDKSSTSNLAPLLLTTGLLLFGFMILVIGIDSMHMRPDEELTFRNMSLSFVDSMVKLATRNNQAPLWWMQIWGWQRTAGLTEFAGRVNSILWSMLTLAVIFQIGKSWFGDRRYGWFSIAILSVNSYFFIYALEIRMYALGMLVVALSMRAFHGWLTKQTWQSALLYGLSTVLMLYTHYYYAFVILAQVAYFAIFHLLNWKLIKQGLLLAVVALLVWLPGILILYNQLIWISFGEIGGLNIPTKPTNLQTILELAQVSSNGLWWLYGGIILAGLILLWRKRFFWLAIAWLILSPGIVLLINLEATIYNVRYTSFFIPAIGLTIGSIIAALPLARFGRWINWLLLIIICGLSLYNLQAYIPVRVPYRHIFEDVSIHYEEGDVLYALPLHEDIYLEDQYNRYLPASLVDNRVFPIDEVISNRRIWFITNFFLEDDVQNRFRSLENTHRVWYVADKSECSRAYCYIAQLMIAAPHEPVFFAETIGFSGADISPIENNQLPVILWWSVYETPDADYSISLQLLREDGSLVSQVDRQIDPPGDEFGEIPTSEMQAGNSYIDERLLDIPADLANGDYQLKVVVYQWWDGERLTIPDGSDAMQIDTITINNHSRD